MAVMEGQAEASGDVDKPSQSLSAADLKACGNEAYQRQEFDAAVGYWNKALRQFVEEMAPGAAGSSSLDPSRRDLERSLYLNLAQGYLKLGEPDRTLRACVLVLQDDAANDKALFRAAEACLALKHREKAAEWISKLLAVDPAHTEAKRLLQRIEAERREEARKQKSAAQAAARRMLGACDGLSDDRASSSKSILPDSVTDTLRHMEAESLCKNVDIATAAAHAARQREANIQARTAEKLPEPATVDLDAFRAKVMAKTQKFNKFVDRSRKQQENAGRGLKLAWLRSGKDVHDLGSFQQTLRAEADEIEAADLAAESEEAAAAEVSEPVLAEQPMPEIAEACCMAEMD